MNAKQLGQLFVSVSIDDAAKAAQIAEDIWWHHNERRGIAA